MLCFYNYESYEIGMSLCIQAHRRSFKKIYYIKYVLSFARCQRHQLELLKTDESTSVEVGSHLPKGLVLFVSMKVYQN